MCLRKWKRVWSEFGAYSKLKKEYACTIFFSEKICVHKGCLNWKKPSARIFFLCLEYAPNSGVEFGVCSKLEVEFGAAPNQRFEFKVCSVSNSGFEFGVCSKLEVWVWSTLQTRGLSLGYAPNSRCEFGVRSKLGVWVWSALQTRGLSLRYAPNSRFEFGVRSKLEVWVWGTLQTRGLSLGCAPGSRFEFGVRSKLGFSLEWPPNAGNDGLGARNKNQHVCNHNRWFFSGNNSAS